VPEWEYISFMIYQDTMSEALKWAFLVFAAGFIGFFGKYLGKIIMTRFHKDNGPEGADAHPPSPEPALSRDEKQLKKAEKNRLKGEKKLAKKAPGEEKQ
jgi:hypothetical protein